MNALQARINQLSTATLKATLGMLDQQIANLRKTDAVAEIQNRQSVRFEVISTLELRDVAFVDSYFAARREMVGA